MKKKITVSDKTDPIVRYTVIAETSEELFRMPGTGNGDKNLLARTKLDMTVHADSQKNVGTLTAYILQVPTMQVGSAERADKQPLPAMQVAVDWLCNHASWRQMLNKSKESQDSPDLILPITTALYVESMFVEPPHRLHGIGTAMLDYSVVLARPDAVCAFISAQNSPELAVFLRRVGLVNRGTFTVNRPWERKELYESDR